MLTPDFNKGSSYGCFPFRPNNVFVQNFTLNTEKKTQMCPNLYKKHRGGSVRVTILPYAIILTKANSAAVSIMAKGCISALVLPLRCFLFLLLSFIHLYNYDAMFSYFVKKEVLQQEYSKPPILHSPHLWWLVNVYRGTCIPNPPLSPSLDQCLDSPMGLLLQLYTSISSKIVKKIYQLRYEKEK